MNRYVAMDDNESYTHSQIFCKTLPYLCPKSFCMKVRVVLAIFFLVLSKACDLVGPVITGMVVTEMSKDDFKFSKVEMLIFVYVALMFGSKFFSESSNMVWYHVAALQERDIALMTFQHLQALSLDWHLNRETGKVLRSISRGARSFSSVLQMVLFRIFPVFVQVIVVGVYLFLKFDWYFGAMTMRIILIYIVFTFTTTEWRNQYRRIMNQKDNLFNQRATDALLNFTTVKYFNSEKHEENR
eukprot:UN23825